LYRYLDHVVEFFHEENTEEVYQAMFVDITELIEAVEDLRNKTESHPSPVAGGQVHRLQQYVYQMQTEFEKMKAICEYKTPAQLRAFSYVTLFVFPFMFSTYFAQVAYAVTTTFALGAAVLTSLVMTALLNVADRVELIFDYTDYRNEFIDLVFPVAQLKVAMKIVGDEEDTEGAVKAGIGGVVSNPVTTEDGSGSKQSEWKRME